MSVKRYEPSSHRSADNGMAEQENGKWVSYDTYVRLEAEANKWKSWAEAEHAEKKALKTELADAQESYHLVNEAVAKINAENARLKAEVERLTKQNALATPRSLIASQDIKTLREQVERLTKAGDALAGEAIRLEYSNYWSEYEKVEDVCIDEVEAWHNAKGVQS